SAFANDDAKHFPNIFFGFEKFFAFALANHTADQPPTYEVAQIAVSISTADLEILHDVVSAKRCWGGKEHSVNLCHSLIDSPVTPNDSPLTDKLVPCFPQRCHGIVSIVHVVSVNTETTVCQI